MKQIFRTESDDDIVTAYQDSDTGAITLSIVSRYGESCRAEITALEATGLGVALNSASFRFMPTERPQT